MKFAIIGAGVAGSYLGSMLYNGGHDIEIYESQQKEKHWPVCAWGASRHMLEYFSKKANLEFNNYIFHIGKKIRMELPNNKEETLVIDGLVTYNKKQWENDLLKNIEIKYGIVGKKENFPLDKFDYVLDCTGFHRAFLPKPKDDFIIPAYEYLIENVNEIEEFYVIGYKGARGYFWYFPLDNGMAFVGAGDIDRKYYGIKEFFDRHPHVKIIKKIGRPIRLSPPLLMEPFYHDNIIGVGESIGTVFPMLGEGIIPSLLCCEIFLDILKKNPEKFNKEEYRKRVLKKFQYYHDVYKIIRLKMDGKLSTVKHFNLLLSMYKNMKKEEKRFGFEVNFDKMRRLVNAL
ncbi:MAG TPA: NAD(P)/FAD-dependent oxidoreductase [Verrucomicrobiae bacterium]|nr:NAD(P)/FAD-dependent oxidoreductase [Verrucomicrobiae bacterium]